MNDAGGRWGENLLRFAAVVAVLLVFAQILLFWRFSADDTFISLRYVRNLVEGRGLVFNVGERVEGFSNPLLVALVACAVRLGVPALLASKLVGFFAYLATAAALVRHAWTTATSRDVRTTLLLVPLAVTLPAFGLTFFGVAGLETLLAAFLVLLVVLATANGRATAAWIAAALLAATRPEGAMYAAVPALDALIGLRRVASADRIRHLSRQLPGAALFTVIVGSGVGVRFWYYGSVVPNTFFAKAPWAIGTNAGDWAWPFRGFDDMGGFFAQTFAPALAALIVVLRRDLLSAPHTRPSLIALGCGLLFQKWAGGDWMLGARFLVPVLPVAGLLWIAAVRELGKRIEPRALRIAVAAGALVALCSHAGQAWDFITYQNRYPNCQMTGVGLDEMGRWLRANADPRWTLWCPFIGIIGWESDLRILDPQGLVADRAAKILAGNESNAAEESALGAYFRSAQPELVIAEGRDLKNSTEFYGLRYNFVRRGWNGTLPLDLYVRAELTAQFPAPLEAPGVAQPSAPRPATAP